MAAYPTLPLKGVLVRFSATTKIEMKILISNFSNASGVFSIHSMKRTSISARNLKGISMVFLDYCGNSWVWVRRKIRKSPIGKLRKVIFYCSFIKKIANIKNRPSTAILSCTQKSKLLISIFLFPFFISSKWKTHGILIFIFNFYIGWKSNGRKPHGPSRWLDFVSGKDRKCWLSMFLAKQLFVWT